MALTSLTSLTVNASIAAVSNDLGSAAVTLAKTYGTAMTDGASAGQANRVWWDQRTLIASASEDLDLAGAALLDPFGVAVVFARIKALVVYADPGNTNNVLVGGASATQVAGLFSNVNDIAVVRPGAAVSWICGAADATGYVVTAGTGDLLKIANSGGTTPVTYEITILGTAT